MLCESGQRPPSKVQHAECLTAPPDWNAFETLGWTWCFAFRIIQTSLSIKCWSLGNAFIMWTEVWTDQLSIWLVIVAERPHIFLTHRPADFCHWIGTSPNISQILSIAPNPLHLIFIYNISSIAQRGGGSFKNRKPIGEVACCESRMAERIHWWKERWLAGAVFFGVVAMVAVIASPQLLDVVWCSCSCCVV